MKEKTFRNFRFEGPKSWFNISPDLCKSCGLCKEKCPTDVLDWSKELAVYGAPMMGPARIEACIACGICEMVCPDAAILIERKDNKKKAVNNA